MMSFELSSSSNKRTADDHASNVLNKLIDFYEKEEYCDTVVIAEIDNTKVRAHQVALAASSEYFRAKFRNALEESTLGEVKVEAIDGITLKSVINFIYTGSIELCSETVESFIKTANFFQIDSLITVCSDFMAENIDVSNCFSVAQFAEQYNLSILATKSSEFVCKNFDKLSDKKEFLDLNENQLCCLLSQDDLHVESEEKLFHKVVAWIDHDQENRKNSLLNLLKNICFTSLTPIFIVDNILLICNTDKCYELVRKWLQWHMSPEKRPQLLLNKTKARKSTKKLYLLSYSSTSGIVIHTSSSDFNTWSQYVLPPAPIESSDFHFSITNTNRLVIGPSESGSIQCFDFETKQWSVVSATSPDLGFYLNENIYKFFGQNFNSLRKYDYSSDTWQIMADLPSNFTQKSLSKIDTLLYALSMDFRLQCYDPVVNKWTAKKNPIGKSVITGVKKNLYAFAGGCNAVLRYNPLEDIWNTTGSLDIGKFLSRTTFNNKIVTYGIKNNKGTITEYNPETNEKKILFLEPSPIGVHKYLFTL